MLTGVRTERFSEQHYQQTPENRVFQHSIPGNQIELPEGFQNSLRDVEMVAVSFTEFLSLHCVLSQGVVCESWQLEDGRGVTYPLTGVVNSHMMGMKVGNSTWSTASPTEGNITITFKHIFSGNRYNLSEDSISCVWWDVVNSSWSTHGCQLTSYNTSSSQCSCDHLTNFAIIMDINGIIDINEPMLVWITYIGCSLSLVGLAAAILTLTSLLRTPGSRGNLTNLIHLNLCCCLLVSEVVMLSGLEQTGDAVWCGVVAGLLHYLLLATFCWTGVEGVNLYFMIVQVFETKYSPKWYYHAVSYGLPLVIVAISAASRPQGYGTDEFCWLNPHDHGMIWAFAGPALFILLMNLVIFAMVLRVLRQTPGRCESEKEKKSRRLLRHSVTLVTILGLTWLTGFLFFSEGTLALAVIFTVLNSLQGAMLFLVLVVMQDNRRTEFLRIVRFSNSLTYRFISKTAGTTTTAFAAHDEVPINPRYSGELDLCVSRDLQERIHNTDNKRY
ncbi:latrophilin-like protein LAT-2 [Panulirus ornatus]|uniref:latrophilin-like protein LAT-2 n=1 Tax=Panulirus ornatus TaxID=150431 RepID=UPI003A83B5BF